MKKFWTGVVYLSALCGIIGVFHQIFFQKQVGPTYNASSAGQNGGVTGGNVYIGNQYNYPENNKSAISEPPEKELSPLTIENGNRITVATYFNVHNFGVPLVLINNKKEILIVRSFKFGVYREESLIDTDICNVQVRNLLDINKLITSIDLPISLKQNEPYRINLVHQVPSEQISLGKYKCRISVHLSDGSQFDKIFSFEITNNYHADINARQIVQILIDE